MLDTVQGEDFIKKIPHPNLLPEPCMAQEKGLSILISLPINDHLLIYERDLIGFHQVLGMLTI
ncbi:MAG: hypothetical protein WB445_06075 [Acinetobacter sp.]